ncbi:MAG: indolepyruvate ferredoxin oxidoreductase [Frankiales bacterium]|nr:indolepyruvate ferredoxin oxidoreductase [Frankiales bacterium]
MTALDDRPAGSSRPAARTAYRPKDRFVPGARPVLLTGVQAIARLLVEQSVRDARAGKRVASLVSGYPGSPLGGLDKLLASTPGLEEDFGVHLVPGMNEELGATAVWGSQSVPGTSTHDGVLGVWYGKGPGVDRAGDALRHGNTYGASATGGVLVMAGDDPAAKSSTVPCTSERTLASFGMPVVTPRNGTELIRFGLMGVALSRLSGCFVGVKVLADVADGLWTVDEDFAALDVVVPEVEWNGRPWTYRQLAMRDPRESTVAEAQLLGPRWAAVEAFGAANPLDEITVRAPGAWLGIMSTGTAYDATLQALRDLGIADPAAAGVRVMRVGMPYPLGAGLVREFAAGLEQIVVVEEKTSFLESQVKDVLYGKTGAPVVVGKRGTDGRLLVPADGQVTADRLDSPLRRVFGDRVALAPRPPAPRTHLPIAVAQRTPYFCSGCPHNRSTVLPEGSLGGGGIGCHTMVTVSERPDSQVLGLTQMGGEGTQWIGQAPFSDVGHIFQNVGDGTYFHSGQLALQACVAAGVNITYKILFNQVVAMTGAQDAQGGLEVPALTRKLHAEGVGKIIVCAEEPERYGKSAQFAPGVTVWHRDRLDEAQRLLRDVPGVTVLVYDQQCAAEARRLRKRGKAEQSTTRVIINQAVCEGCGDCGVKSNCLSVQPVDTEFGRKTQIDQSSCNTDFSCLQGDCPSFVTVTVPATSERRTPPPAPRVPEPVLPVPSPTYDVFLAGIGGTGIVTVNAVLATAALTQGLRSAGLDQTGLSQKAGPVTSHLRLSVEGGEPANRLSEGGADAVLAFDLLVASDPKHLPRSSPERTVVVASTSRTPTGEMVFDPSVAYPEEGPMLARLAGASRRVETLDALAAAEALFGGTEAANLLVVGAAYQAGALPLSAESLEHAIGLNGVAVDVNVAAFRWGRVSVADPAAFATATAGPAARPGPDGSAFLVGRALEGETRRLVSIRAAGLRDHSGARAASRYVALVERAWLAEKDLGVGTAYSEAVARGVHRLAAYKDEYEVARLLTDPGLEQDVLSQVPGATAVTYNLHPPALRSAGMTSKLKLRARTFRPVLTVLARGRALRGTPLDPFGQATVRKVERALHAEYVALVDALTSGLDHGSYDRAVELAETPELVRGYEDVKLRSVQVYRDRREELGAPVDAAVTRLLA